MSFLLSKLLCHFKLQLGNEQLKGTPAVDYVVSIKLGDL